MNENEISGSHSGHNEHCCDSSLVAIYQHRCVLTEMYSNKLVTIAKDQFATQTIKAEDKPYYCYYCSPYRHYHSPDFNWGFQVFLYCTSSQSTCQVCHTLKWETNKIK